MIEYLPNPSIYFKQNFDFCERITEELKSLDITFDGSCTSFGYDIYFEIHSGSTHYKVNYHKHQSTVTPVVLKVDTRTRQYVKIEATNLLTLGFMKVNGTRLFSPQLWGKFHIKLSDKIDLYSNSAFEKSKQNDALEIFEELDIIRLTKKRERVKASFWNDSLLPSEIIERFDKLVQTIAE